MPKFSLLRASALKTSTPLVIPDALSIIITAKYAKNLKD